MRRFLTLLVVLIGLVGAGQTMACPNWNNPTVFGQTYLNAGFLPDPYVRNLTAGGRINLANCRPYLGPGWVVSRPDFRLQYQGVSPTGRLTIALEARSNVDTVLVVNSPDGAWHYNDDYRGLNSAIVFFNPMSGQYDIWAGSYYRSSNNPARLIITEYNY